MLAKAANSLQSQRGLSAALAKRDNKQSPQHRKVSHSNGPRPHAATFLPRTRVAGVCEGRSGGGGGGVSNQSVVSTGSHSTLLFSFPLI